MLEYIRRPKNKTKIIKVFGYTQDIINAILGKFEADKLQTKDFAEALRRKYPAREKRLESLYDFLVKNVRFVEDRDGEQNLKSPEALIWSGFGDCKSFSIFVASVLWNLGENFCFRFVSYGSSNVTHVYVVTNDIILDCTIKKYNRELPYKFKKDFCMNSTKIASITGARVGETLPYNSSFANLQNYATTTQTTAPKVDWTSVLNSTVQLLPQILNPTLPQNQNNTQSAQLLAQQIAQNQQALINNFQAQTQQAQQTGANFFQNPLVLGALGLAVYLLTSKKKI